MVPPKASPAPQFAACFSRPNQKWDFTFKKYNIIMFASVRRKKRSVKGEAKQLPEEI